eukprot:3000740-Prymnesium_polylepis.1
MGIAGVQQQEGQQAAEGLLAEAEAASRASAEQGAHMHGRARPAADELWIHCVVVLGGGGEREIYDIGGAITQERMNAGVGRVDMARSLCRCEFRVWLAINV